MSAVEYKESYFGMSPITASITHGRRFAILAIAAIVLFAAVVFTGLASAGVVEPDPGCAICHVEGRHVESREVHAGVACYDCHSRPGAWGRLTRLSFDVSSVLEGLPDERAQAVMASDSCLECHASIKVVRTRRAGLVMDHGACLDGSMACMDCHSDTGHGVGAPGRTLNMDSCSRCHDGVRASRACDVCHEGDSDRTDELNAWAQTHGEGWRGTHGMGELTTCATCHDEKKCSQCHLPVPHSADWPRTHGAVAVSRGKVACLTCHQSQLCDDCHTAEMPHPDSWLFAHISDAASKERAENCTTCHSAADCVDCHEAHTHPGLSPERIEELTR